MRIGIMLRHINELGGINVYTKNIIRSLLKIDNKNEYILLYRNSKELGLFSNYANVEEHTLKSYNKLWWDQIAVPRFARKERLDLIYNPKLSIPLFTQCKTVLVMHGAEQFVVPWAFKWHDRVYFTIANRLYCKRADAIIAMTNMGAHDIAKYMWAKPSKIHVIPEAYNENCRVLNAEEKQRIKKKYALPDHYFLFVGGLTPLKNLRNILFAYSKVKNYFQQKLVIVGFKRFKFKADLALIEKLNLERDIIFPGFVPDIDLPGFYNLASALIFPSLYEGFGIPALEAMACGCPVITSKTACTCEITGDAAILVDPYNPDEIAESMRRLLTDHSLRNQMIERGLSRVKQFSWEKCAAQTLNVFENLKNNQA